MYHNAIKLCNKLLSIYFNGYNNVTDKEKGKMVEAYNLNNQLADPFSKSAIKVADLLNGRKKMKKKVNHSPKMLLLKE